MKINMILDRPPDIEQLISVLSTMQLDKPLAVKIEPHKRKRSLDQNALYWMWLTELSKYLIEKGRQFATKEWCHDAMRHSFLGYEKKELVDVNTGEVQERLSIRSTTKLQSGEFTHYLVQIEVWALGIGCLLTVPEDSEYMRLKREQEQ